MRTMQVKIPAFGRRLLRSDRDTLLLPAVRRDIEVLSELPRVSERAGRKSGQGLPFPPDLVRRGGGDPPCARQRMIGMIRV